MGAQWLNYRGAADSMTFLTILCTYLGMAFVVFLPASPNSGPSAKPPPPRSGSQAHLKSTDSEVGSAPAGSDDSDVPESPGNTADDLDDPMAKPLRRGPWRSRVDRLATLVAARLRAAAAAVDHRALAGLAAVDVASQAIGVAGLFLTGSGLYMVVFSSVIVFTALGNRVLLGRRVSSRQWAAIAVISAGLGLTAVARPPAAASAAAVDLGAPGAVDGSGAAAAAALASRVAAGVGVSLLGTWMHSLCYTLTDYFLAGSPHGGGGGGAGPAPDGVRRGGNWGARTQCVWVGTYASTWTLALMAAVSVPSLRRLSPALGRPANLAAYALLVLSSLAHSLVYFELVERTGAVATGVLQALRAVAVFAASHAAFCKVDSAQCLTPPKAVAAAIVVGGVLLFAAASAAAAAQAPPQLAPAADAPLPPRSPARGPTFRRNQRWYAPVASRADDDEEADGFDDSCADEVLDLGVPLRPLQGQAPAPPPPPASVSASS
ncbi:hypothetical protein HK405_013947 [Cladochytrium tenue]|nr:hypothetical protein HK405_013947 [Cladochytrium tenue]